MKRITASLLAGALALSLVACGGTPASSSAGQAGTPASSDAASSAASALSGAVTTGGSTSVEGVIGILTEAFREVQPDVDVTYDPTGSRRRHHRRLRGHAGHRPFQPRAEGGRGRDLVGATAFALDGIAIIVNNENTVDRPDRWSRSRAWPRATITNWSEVGGPDAPRCAGGP